MLLTESPLETLLRACRAFPGKRIKTCWDQWLIVLWDRVMARGEPRAAAASPRPGIPSTGTGISLGVAVGLRGEVAAGQGDGERHVDDFRGHVPAAGRPPGVQGLGGFLDALQVGKGEQGLP